jgi:hypothetical protein
MGNKPKYGFAKSLKLVCNDRRPLEDREGAFSHLRRKLIPLYYDVISEADFIVATPVVASKHLAGFYKPDLIIFDECAHAHELSTLIALAHFEPKAWFFTGDHRQNEPYVNTTRFAQENKPHLRRIRLGVRTQLRISTMERAAVNGAIPHQLREYWLEWLSSTLASLLLPRG